MNKREIIIVIIAILIFSAIYYDQTFEPENIEMLRESANARAEVVPPKEFTTDGCTLWLNSIFENDFTDICIEHDIQYWKGGSEKDKKAADIILRDSINKKIPFIGDIMYIGIRAFGQLGPAPWRWGYGFEYPYAY